MINTLVTQNLKEILGMYLPDVGLKETEGGADLVLDLTESLELVCLILGQSDLIIMILIDVTIGVPLTVKGHDILGPIQITGHGRAQTLKMSIRSHIQGARHPIPTET